MSRPLLLLVCAFTALLGGAWLVGMWMVGVAVMVEAVTVAVFAVLWDDGKQPLGPERDPHETLMEWYRRSQ
jgi:hypothetical protein